MDFDLTEEQESLRDSVRSVLARVCPPAAVRQAFEAKSPAGDWRADPLWSQMVELGWPGLTVPEAFGGLGLHAVETSLVVAELGRVVAPSPFLATATQFAAMVRRTGSPDQQRELLAPLVDAGATGTVALAEEQGSWDLASVRASARRDGQDWVLAGTKSFVFDGDTADHVAVVARRAGSEDLQGLGVFVMPGSSVRSRRMATIDPSQPLAELDLEGGRVPPDLVLAEPEDAGAASRISLAVAEATTALAASMTGTCRAIFDMTLQYAKDREQYGRPIGSFQALKHRLVDMYLSVERAASLVSFAALTLDEEDPRHSFAVAAAKAAAGGCQRLVVQEGLQMHGGVGFMWESDLHMYLKRAKSADPLWGSSATHRASIARALGLVAGQGTSS